MDTFRLKAFFLELLEVSYDDVRPGWGNPCKNLLRKMVLQQNHLIARIKGDYTGESHELRLNDAGLKLYWRVDKETRKFQCSIGGDQAKEYPFFVAEARRRIGYYNFNKQ